MWMFCYMCVSVNAMCLCVKEAPSMLWLSRWTSLRRQNGGKCACGAVCLCVHENFCGLRPDILLLRLMSLRGRHLNKVGDTRRKERIQDTKEAKLFPQLHSNKKHRLGKSVFVWVAVKRCFYSDLPLCYQAQQALCWLMTSAALMRKAEWYHSVWTCVCSFSEPWREQRFLLAADI